MVKIRRAYEVLFLGLFLFFLVITDLRYLKGWPVSLFLEATPLVAVATALTTHTIYRNLVWGLVIIAVTMMLGRVWCNWMCPFGILHHFFGWIGNRRNTKQMIEVNRYRKIYALKYYILAAMIAMAALWIIPTAIDTPGQIWHAYRGAELRQTGATRVLAAIETGFSRAAEEHKRNNSSLQIGLLDPIALTVRSMTTSVLPTVHNATESIYTEPREYWQAWVVGLIFIGFLVANWWIPRFFCRAICPLGALLGVFSRFAIWRIDRDPVRCTDCDLCLKSCEGASDPQGDLRKSECFVCLNCIEDCPHDALSFRFLPRKASEVTNPAVGRRQLVLAGLFGLFFFPMARLSGGVRKNFQRGVIRPPGSVAEDEFLRRCIKCDQCIRVCPTNVLQPALFEAGLEGLWTPIMISKMGWCELNCTLCSQVCPTAPSARSRSSRSWASARSRRRGRSRPARRSTTRADACPGRWTPVAWSARRSARSAPRPSSPATWRSPIDGERRWSSSAPTSTRSSASAAASASTSAPSRTTRPCTSQPSASPAARTARSCSRWSTARGRIGYRSERADGSSIRERRVVPRN